MKPLNKYISQVKRLHSLNEFIQEKLLINKNYKYYTCNPKSFDELRKIIEQRYEEQGPGTKQNPIDFNDIDVSNINSFINRNTGIFEGIRFKYIDISKWDVSNVKDMHGMFFECEKLKSIGDLSKWNVSNVKYMYNMFALCGKLESVGDLSDWDVSKVENMSWMFYKCEKLESVGNLSNWKVSKVKDMHAVFQKCEKLKSVGDLSNWNVSKVKDMRCMFIDSAITNIPDWYKG